MPENATKDLYRNNSWLLDDKYMTYETVLSNRDMGELIQFITSEETPRDDDRTDIALVFSSNPKDKKPFDVVIVELKKKGVSLKEKVELALSGEYTALYSSGKMYCQETTVALSLNPSKTNPIGIFIWDLDAAIDDAEDRNVAFLNLIKAALEKSKRSVFPSGIKRIEFSMRLSLQCSTCQGELDTYI